MRAKGRCVSGRRSAVMALALLASASAAAGQGIRRVAEGDAPIAIQTQVRHTTTVVVPETEAIVDVVAGDSDYWDVSASANVAYVKPLEQGVGSNVTLVAGSGRVWALLVSESGDVEPDLVVYIEAQSAGPGTLSRHRGPAFTAGLELQTHRAEEIAARAELRAVEAAVERELAAVRGEREAAEAAWLVEYPSRLRFPYVLEARARVEPFLVQGMWHDGRFTYLRSLAQETPALLELTDGEPALVGYSVYDDGLYVTDHVVGPGRLVIGESWTAWGDSRRRRRQAWSVKRELWTWGLVGGAVGAAAWMLGR